MKKLTMALLFSIFILIINNISYSQATIFFELSDTVYELRQPIWMSVTMKNIGMQSLKYNLFAFACNVEIVITDKSGKEYLYNGVRFHFGAKPPTEILAPEEKIVIKGNLLDYYGIFEDDVSIWKYLPKGTYEAFIIVKMVEDTVYFSHKLSFRIKEPEGTAKEQHEIIVNARALNKERKFDQEIKLYKQFIDKYPSSKYADMVMNELIGASFVQTGNYDESLITELVTKYPFSYYAVSRLRAIVEIQYKDHESNKERKAQKLLKSLIQNFPKTAVGQEAKTLLNKYE